MSKSMVHLQEPMPVSNPNAPKVEEEDPKVVEVVVSGTEPVVLLRLLVSPAAAVTV